MGIHRTLEIEAPARVTVRPFVPSDSVPVLIDMSSRSRSENFSSGETLAIYTNMSEEVLTAELDGQPVAVFGLIEAGDRMGSWAVLTKVCESHKVLTWKTAKVVMGYWLEHYPRIFSSISEGDSIHRRWLESLGCEFGEAIEGRHYFERVR